MAVTTRERADRLIVVAAGVVIIALTGAAFWLSYAHLADIAKAHGLSGARAWAWPATLDLGIVAGELLMLRAALQGRTDWWAIALMVAGSSGSIALNVAGVGDDAETLDYVVAAVPPSAALLAFGVMMRQIHRWLAHAEAPGVEEVEEALPKVDAAPVHPASTLQETPAPALPQEGSAPAHPQVICGGSGLFHPSFPLASTTDAGGQGDVEKLPAETALAVIRTCWAMGKTLPEAARESTRSTSYVHKVYKRLDSETRAEAAVVDREPAEAAS